MTTATPSNIPYLIGQFFAFGIQLDILQTERAGRPFYQVLSSDSGSPFGTLSVVAPKVSLKPGEALIRMHSENAPLRAPLLASGYFKDTGRRVPSGYVELEIWARSEPAALPPPVAPAPKPVVKKK